MREGMRDELDVVEVDGQVEDGGDARPLRAHLVRARLRARLRVRLRARLRVRVRLRVRRGRRWRRPH